MAAEEDDRVLGEQLKALVATAVDAIISADAEGTIRFCNPAVERLFGWTPDELVGRNVSVLMPDGHARHHDGYMRRYLDGGTPRIIGKGREVDGLRKDGELFPLHLSVGEYVVGKESFFVGIMRDLTNERREQARLRELEEQLAVLGRRSAVSEMGAALAHELNQPLTAIDLFLAAAERAFDSNPEKSRKLFEDAREQARRAGDMVRRIRQMVEKSDDRRTLFPLAPVLDDAVKLCHLTDASRRARIDVRGADGVMVYGDEIQIRQVLVNLIKNALEATASQPDRRVVVDVNKRTHVEIEVTDNGPGLDESILDGLFEPFRSTKPGGLGVGLSICRSIAENHGGRLEVVLGQDTVPALTGARFRLRLPDTGAEAATRDHDNDRDHQ